MIKSRAIVLHRFAYSDSSWIVKVLTEESGIVSFIVKGGKRKDSPFKGALDPLALSEIVFRENPNTELQFLREATLLDWRHGLRENLLQLAKAQVMAEMILRYAPQGVPLQGEFELFERALREMEPAAGISTAGNDGAGSVPERYASAGITTASSAPAGNTPESRTCKSKNPASASRATNAFARWLLDMCDLWGYSLDMQTCSRCGRDIDGCAADFHPETGNFICRDCLGVETPRARKDTLEGLYALTAGTRVAHPEFTENALLTYLRHHIGFLKEIHSLKFLNDARKLFPEDPAP